MRSKDLQFPFFIMLSIGVATLVFFIVLPFFTPLIAAAALAVVLWPVKTWFLERFRGHHGYAALATATIAFILIMIPLAILGFQLFRESATLYRDFTSGSLPDIEALSDNIETPIRVYFPSFSLDLKPAASDLFKWFIDHLDSIFAGTLQTALAFFVGLVAFYYFLKDGDRFRRKIVLLSPLPDREDEAILAKLGATIDSVMLGTLLVSIIQGLLTGIGFAFFGIPNSTLWGSLAMIASLIPGFGTSLVLVPGIAYLAAIGAVPNAIGLAIWSVTAVGLIDNLLRPYLVGRGIHVHPLLILIAVFGGLALFGPLGFLIGPVVLSLMLALVDLYFSIYVGKKSRTANVK